MLAKDIAGNLYVIAELHGVYSIRTMAGELLNFGTDLERLLKSTLGYHAELYTF